MAKEILPQDCLVCLYTPEELGIPRSELKSNNNGYRISVRQYETEADALNAYCETPCYHSKVVNRSQAGSCKIMFDMGMVKELMYLLIN